MTRCHRLLGVGALLVAASVMGSAVSGTVSVAAVTVPDPVIAAAGDIACPPPASPTAAKCHQGTTAAELVAGGYAAVLALGDEQYPCGLLSDFLDVYDRTWGAVRNITYPIPGDNEYVGNNGCKSGPAADGYFQYFGDEATPLQPGCRSACKAYYSYDIGAWHIVALNSECSAPGVGGCGTSSAQYKWLQQDLAANSTSCALAYFHKAHWGNGTVRRPTTALVQALYNKGVELLLSGHDHLYVRFAPQTPGSVASPTGIRQFVVGTGGVNLGSLKPNLPNTEFKQNTSFGVLELSLHPTSYDWRFRSDTKLSDGSYKVLDSGSADCH